jgi:hypothetical protein
MHRSTLSGRVSRLAVLLPFVIAGCSDDPGATAGANDGGASRDAAQADGGTESGAVDTTHPTVVGSTPANAATGEPTSVAMTATFSEAMAPSTVTGTSVRVTQGTTPVPGTVTYLNRTVTFAPSAELALATTYTVAITTAVQDLAGNPLATEHTWSFTTDTVARVGPPPVFLGTAGRYVIVAKTAISNVPTSKVTGDVALSPAAASYITGFALTRAGTHWTAPEVTGLLFAANNDPPTPTTLTTAVGDMQIAYTDAAGRPTPRFLNLGGGAIGGSTLTPGLYKWTSSVTIPSDVVLHGGRNDVWIFQIDGDLALSAAKSMTLTGGARAKNVFWQVAGTVEMGTSSHGEGVMLSQTAIKVGTGASLNGRLLAQTAVTLASATVTTPAE